MSAFARAAYIVSARHLNGSVVCKAADALPFLLRVGQTVHFVPPTLRGPRAAQVASIEEMPTGAWEVTFEGVDNIDIAESLAGSYCLVAEDELPEITVEDDAAVLKGFAVQDSTYGDLGVIEDVLVNPAQTTLDIQGPHGQVLVPFVDEFVAEVDEDARVVHTHIPESLLVLNAPGQDVGNARGEGESAEGGES